MATTGSQTGRGKITVALAHELPGVRRAVRTLLECERDLAVVAEADDIQSSEAIVLAHQPTILIIGRDLPGVPSPEEVARATAPSPGTRVVVLGLDDHPSAHRAALVAGAQGYVALGHAGADLAPAIRAAAASSR